MRFNPRLKIIRFWPTTLIGELFAVYNFVKDDLIPTDVVLRGRTDTSAPVSIKNVSLDIASSTCRRNSVLFVVGFPLSSATSTWLQSDFRSFMEQNITIYDRCHLYLLTAVDIFVDASNVR